MAYLLPGALVEYGVGLIGPISNVVIFQFNPETLTRTIQIPPRPTAAKHTEKAQSGDAPIEKISLTAHFDAADRLAANDPLARAFGIGPQLAALEAMVFPKAAGGGFSLSVSVSVGAMGGALGGGGSAGTPAPVPREQYPRTLFIWGATRVLPVIVESMTITEKLYDNCLNPVQAEVALGLAVISKLDKDDVVGKGALAYSNMVKKTQAVSNLANTAGQIMDIVKL